MAGIYNSPRVKVDNYGRVITTSKGPADFDHILNRYVNSIIDFEQGTDELSRDDSIIILPRHYFIFIGVKDGEIQYKPYEHNKYRIVVTTYKDIIISVDSIG